ncbi:hypothetical protein [Paraburkholderia rhizosphaerae]|uniref:Uncharacterized protein n=1 Tax=Paraburkholderia rhizosphaerae TaxID=480658 RepID=A0A4R8LKS4_9BURK|nr:hypothetical protein [Paraburkholderia rhizosphaerae]TDY45153.1 hypothetical protein BX592_115120 [Paraburkholderia rhizosphaerae]
MPVSLQRIDLVFGYKLEVVPECELSAAEAEVKAIRETVMSPHGWGAVAAFFISGATPEEK